MTHRSRRWGACLARMAAVFGAVVVLGAGRLAAQGTTGKIEGFVRDQSGAPISGAQVLIVGSAFSAGTNEQGYYFINNVPAGVMAVRAQYIGYAPAEVRNVRVFAGQTHSVNLTLEQRAIEVTGITVTVEQNPLVPRDQVASKPIVSGELIDQLPADNISDVLRLQPGVIQTNRGLIIRGGRPGEAATYIDGVLVRNFTSTFGRGQGTTGTVSVGTNAVEEASVTTGAIGSEFGEAQSGVISIVTRSGGPTYRGTISYSTDEISGQTYGQGLHRLEASFGGPLWRNLTFFVSTAMEGQQTPRLGKGWEDVPLFVVNGVDTSNPEAPTGYVTAPTSPGNPTSDSVRVALPTFARYSDGARRPDDAQDSWDWSAKLQYSYGTGSRLSATFLNSRDQNLFFREGDLYNPQAQQGALERNRAVILNWTQNLSRSAERALFLEANASWQRDEFLSGPLDPAWFNDHRDPFAWFNFSSMQHVVNFDNFPIDDRLITNVRLGTSACNNTRDIGGGRTAGGCVPYLGRNDFFSRARYRANPYGVLMNTEGMGDPFTVLSRESRLTARVNVDWQANRYNRVRFGGDWLRVDMSQWAGDLVEFFSLDAFREEPTKLGLFAQDRLDLGDVVVELGLRYDRISTGFQYPRALARTFNDPIRSGSLATAYTAQDTLLAQRCGQLATAVAAAGATYADSVAYSTCNFIEMEPRSRLAPSLRISFPVTDRTGFRLSYSHQVQTPNFNDMARRINADIAYTNTNATFGRPLNFGRSIQFEFGVRHAFSDDMVLDVAAYNKDKVSDVAFRTIGFLDPFNNRTINYNVVTNQDFGNVRGVDIKLDRRIGSLFQGSLSYSLLVARGTGSDPFEYLGTISRQISTVTGDRSPPPQALLATRDDRTHTIAGSASLNFPNDWRQGTTWGAILRDVGMFAIWRFESGLPYTRMVNGGNGQVGPGNNFGLVGEAAEPLNSSRSPWVRNVDLRVTKGFRFGSRDLTLFADFRNLFNFTNVVALYAETGDVRNDVFQDHTLQPVRDQLFGEAGPLVRTRNVSRPDGSTVVRTGIDLSDCSLYPYQSGGAAGAPNCLMLRGVERRFDLDGQANDLFLDEDELNAAFEAFYNLFAGPQRFRGAGFNLRLGFELHF